MDPERSDAREPRNLGEVQVALPKTSHAGRRSGPIWHPTEMTPLVRRYEAIIEHIEALIEERREKRSVVIP